ncbi:hypothetical protein GCM10010503_17600 [Streptomyces lucensis JCM 4490]|uniref:SCP domain-containing protein n=1 Tax=Streptomyces lucensis JCM 4490 TaxID=1306176 RepID=A0A918J0P6_9ACTN|nr:CAP domain-containing protein [Streptomyces lucensis]GGW41838.1 hypothetical protein GCM10010503_17600 [Streptomyces lucensis JCM 4490]
MGQHRRTQKYRRIVVTAVAIGAVGVPSAALACTDWPDGTQDASYAAPTSTPVTQWQHVQRHHHRNIVETGAPRTTTPPAPRATADAGAEHKAGVHKKVHKKKVRVHRPTSAAAGTPRTAPAPTPSASTAGATPSAPAAAPSAPKATATASGVTARILELVNAERAKVGCQALTLNSALTKAAQAHSADMAAHQNMSHTGSDGSMPGDRITRAGYVWSSYGENVAYGYATADQVMAGWMASPGHRENILNCAFKEIGVGLAQPNSYWTQDFGTAR